MPIYEYRCPSCSKRSSVFFRSFSAAEGAEPQCTHCGAAGLTRLISRVAVLRSGGDDDFGGLDDFSGVDENDPRSMARWLRKAGRELGEDAGPEFEEAIDRLEAGESMDDIEAGMGGSDDFGGMGDMGGLGGGMDDF